MDGTQRARWFVVGWSLLLTLFAVLALVSWLTPGGVWWLPVAWAVGGVVAGGNLLMWWPNARKRDQR
jgi:hypothetical protein